MVAGFEKTFEIGRIFRNEGMSPEHAQDYTQMENYRAYADYRQMMTLVKDMYMHIVDTVYPHKNRKFTHQRIWSRFQSRMARDRLRNDYQRKNRDRYIYCYRRTNRSKTYQLAGKIRTTQSY
jgi:lysyl-tRNA synthetase class II